MSKEHNNEEIAIGTPKRRRKKHSENSGQALKAKIVQLSKGAGWAAGRVTRAARGGLISKGARGAFVREFHGERRRVIVKSRVEKNKGKGFSESIKGHLRYMARDGAGEEGSKAKFYGSEGDNLDSKSFLKRCENDEHCFRII